MQRQIQTVALVVCAYATGGTTVVADEAVMDDKQVGNSITWCDRITCFGAEDMALKSLILIGADLSLR